MVKECHHGPDKQRRAKERRKQKPTPGDHNYSRKGKSRKKIQDSKKQSCPAMIRIRAIMKFPDFKIDSYNNKFLKRQISRKLKQAFANRDPIKKSMVYLLSYPSANDHKNHLTGEFAGFTQRVDPKLVTRIKELVAEGVRNVSEMKRHLLISVKNDICPDQDIPKTNRRFFPLDKDIKNHMDIAINSLRFSKDDQLNLETLVESWQESNSEDSFFLRTSYDTTSQGDSPSQDFLFVHQTAWQRRLLDLYGRDICIMDATYKTSKYALPLFFICVQTNVGHSICGSFVLSTESKNAIQEGLKKIKEWNPGWTPKYFITDYDEREIQAVEEVFQECTVYLCSFHREQSWTRWLKQLKHGVGSNQDEIIELMRRIANANSETNYEEAVVKLKENQHWQNNQKLQKWFDKQWLSVSHRWVKALRQNNFNIRMTTTNGLERKHQEFKRGYLSHYSEGSLCTMITTLVSNFLPDSYRSYITYNIQSLEFCKKYSTSVPTFLHNRPRMLVEHCIKRIPPEVQNIPVENIQEIGERAFDVHSVDSNNVYKVMITNTEPTCTCEDYARHHLPSSKIKTDAGLPINTSDHHRSPLTLKRKAGSLPLRKKYRKKNVNHSVHFAENDDVMIIDGTYDMPCRQEMSIDSVNTTMEQSMANDTITEQMAECQSKDRPATVEILWTIKPFDYLVSKIGSFKVTDTSISYLKSSLSDEVIDAYLHLLTETKKNKRLLAIDSSIATAIFQGISENFHGFMTQTKFSSYDMILAAVNENNSHWTLIVIHPGDKKLVYINPLGELKRTMQNIGVKWREFILGRVRRGVNELSEDGWKVETVKHTKQYDSNSCGVYVVKFAELVISDMPLMFSCRPDNLHQIRRGIGNQLLQATEPLFEYCRACSLHREARRNEDWIGCEKCDKFFHSGCVGVSNFTCAMCTSLDQHLVNLEPDLRKDPPKIWYLKCKRSSRG
uniref:Uncharacterized protein LOC111107733 n=1 Tax=Crassostrea virginica TaxID=6565 RepID=A0A8B8B6N6_CRAVI|nr:uncharacterized protein LOC111107733 [Crassostrea virginica]